MPVATSLGAKLGSVAKNRLVEDKDSLGVIMQLTYKIAQTQVRLQNSYADFSLAYGEARHSSMAWVTRLTNWSSVYDRVHHLAQRAKRRLAREAV